MSVVTLNAKEYLRALKSGAVDGSVSYAIDGDVSLSGEHAITLKGVAVNGNVTVLSDCEDIIISVLVGSCL